MKDKETRVFLGRFFGLGTVAGSLILEESAQKGIDASVEEIKD